MKGLWKYISPFAPDQSGVCSVLYDLGGIIVRFEANTVEDEYVRIVAKMPLEVEGHLLFGGTPKLGKLILGMKWIEFLVNHGSCSYSFAMAIILTPCR